MDKESEEFALWCILDVHVITFLLNSSTAAFVPCFAMWTIGEIVIWLRGQNYKL
jgi:hypothetical protein